MQLKAFIKKKAAEKNISAQLVLQNYMMERLLERISLSKYKKNFIVKGGFLISAVVGLDMRTTMDLDTTIKGFDLTLENIRKVFKDILDTALEDDVVFELLGTAAIREADDYPGVRVNLKANYSPVSVPLSVDVTTGDQITPREIEYSYSLIFEERKINIMVYPLETILSEKLETILSRGIVNTRARDFYDVYILRKLRSNEIQPAILKTALIKTAEKRGSLKIIERYDSILDDILASEHMQFFWKKYRADYNYAADITLEAAICAAREILDEVSC